MAKALEGSDSGVFDGGNSEYRDTGKARKRTEGASGGFGGFWKVVKAI
jgi:hypothetical protein